MSFNSLGFVLLLPIALLGHHLLSGTALRWWLLAVSYLFYGWGRPEWCVLLALTTALDFFVATRIADASSPGRKKAWLALSLVGNLGMLGLFKYTPLLARWINVSVYVLWGVDPGVHAPQLELPPGISFYTFQTLSYTVDVYRGRQEVVRSLSRLGLFVSYFPQLVAGPIERASDLLPQLENKRAVSHEDRIAGITRILWGLVKKVVFADTFSIWVAEMWGFPSEATTWELLLALHAFSFQVYMDFSAYSDIAVGLGQTMGVRLQENFRHPFLARNPIEFWQRWHITLGTWVRDYLYIPLGGGSGGWWSARWNSLICMLAIGLWHGADEKFLIWGLFHWIYELVYRGWVWAFGSRWKPGAPLTLRDAPAIFLTYNLVIPQVFFGAPTLDHAWYILGRFLEPWGPMASHLPWDDVLRTSGLLALAMATHLVRGAGLLPGLRLSRLGPVATGVVWAGMVTLLVFFHAPEKQRFFYFQF